MKSITITPSNLSGKVLIPPSKSISHRAIICAGLSQGISKIENIAFSNDIIATLDGMKAFGIKVKQTETGKTSTLSIEGSRVLNLENGEINCQESGSTLRFLIPMAGLVDEKVTYYGKGKLVERPLGTYYKIFEEQGIEYSNVDDKLPLTVQGKLKSGTFEVRGNISSQFISGLLFVLPVLNGDSKIVITSELESKGYVDLTLDALNKFGIEVENLDYREFAIRGNQEYKSRDYRVEGDFSQAAFWIVAGILGEHVQCLDLNISSLQGDKAILDIVKAMGADIVIEEDIVESKTSKTKGITIDVSQCPDLVPILTTLAALSNGCTKIINAARLRIKESDRLKAMATELNKLGADVTELEDGLIINGKESLKGGTVDSWNDHRIAMALAIASIKCKEPVTITNSDAVTKSYPGFWEDFSKLGGIIDERSMG